MDVHMTHFNSFWQKLDMHETYRTPVFKQLQTYQQVNVCKYYRETLDAYYMKLVGINTFRRGKTEDIIYLTCSKKELLWYAVVSTETNWETKPIGGNIYELLEDWRKI